MHILEHTNLNYPLKKDKVKKIILDKFTAPLSMIEEDIFITNEGNTHFSELFEVAIEESKVLYQEYITMCTIELLEMYPNDKTLKQIDLWGFFLNLFKEICKALAKVSSTSYFVSGFTLEVIDAINWEIQKFLANEYNSLYNFYLNRSKDDKLLFIVKDLHEFTLLTLGNTNLGRGERDTLVSLTKHNVKETGARVSTLIKLLEL